MSELKPPSASAASNTPRSEAEPPVPEQSPEVSPMARAWRAIRWFVPLGAALLVMGVIALFAYGLLKASRGPNLVSQIAAGEKPSAPDFRLGVFWPPSGPPTTSVEHAIGDGQLDLRRLRGHPVLVNFWASWCIPCRKEAPLLAAAAADHSEVTFIGVDVQDLRGDALAFLRRYHVAYTAVWDKTNSTYEAYGLTGVPETYYIDARGRIIQHTPGAVTFDTLNAGLDSIDPPARR